LLIHEEKEEKMKKLFIRALVALVALSCLPSPARAVCERSAHVVRVTVTPVASTSYIYYRDGALSTFHWRCATNDAKLIDAALAAQNGLTRVIIRGDAASCPVTPATGERSAGNCQIVYVNP
jgi:hypothetical protein